MKLPVVALRDMTVLPGMLMHFDVSSREINFGGGIRDE